MSIKKNIYIIGDVHNDIFCLDHEGKNSEATNGGSFFIEKILEKKRLISNNLPLVVNNFTLIKDNKKVDDEYKKYLGVLFNLKWDVSLYKKTDNQKVLRCVDRLTVQKQPSEENKHVFFDENGLNSINNESDECNFFLMECVGNHGDDKECKYISLLDMLSMISH